MTILPNNVAVIDKCSHHGVWCAEQGLVHDKWMAGLICEHIKPGDVVVDGGANIGTLTFPMLEAGALVFAFEPNPDAVECLKHNCAKFTGELSLIYGALGERFESNLLHQEQNAGASWVGFGDGSGIPVKVIPLDSLAISPKLLKFDCEGCETKALRGARETILKHRPVMFIEVNRGCLERAGSSEDELLGLIEELGYRWEILQWQCKRGSEQYDVRCLPN